MIARLLFALLLVIAAMFSAFMFALNMALGNVTAGILWILTTGIAILLAVFLGVKASSDREGDE